jgi:transposase-like protein
MSNQDSQDVREAIEQEDKAEPFAVGELRAEIEETREQLGETVDAIASKLDVKAQTRRKVSQVKDRVHEATSQVHSRGGAAATGEAHPDLAQLSRQLVSTVRKHPVGAAIALVAVGVVFGRATKIRKRRS